MGKINFGKYKQPEVLIDTIGSRIELKPDGREFRAMCPFHTDSDPSFTLVPDKGYYYCFGCEAKGDALDFVIDFDGVSAKDARKLIDGHEVKDAGTITKRKSVAIPAVDYYKGIEILAPTEQMKAGETYKVWNPKKEKFSTYTPTMVFEYRDIKGDIIANVIRIEFDDNKITPTVAWCKIPKKPDGWSHIVLTEPRPIYGQEYLEGSDKPILIVEGEKAADAADHLMGHNYDVVCWSGGANAYGKSDFSFTKGKDVLLWPDMDAGGMRCMLGYEKNNVWKKGVGDICLDAGATSVKAIRLDDTKDKGWDAADALEEGWTYQTVQAWAKKFVERFTAYEYQSDSEIPPYLQEGPPDEAYHDDLNRYGENIIVPASKEIEVTDYHQLLKYKKDTEEIAPRLLHNGVVLLEHHPHMKGVLAFNENRYTIDLVSRPPWDDNEGKIPRSLEDVDSINAKGWLEVNDMTLSLSDTESAIKAVAHKRKYNPLKSFINSCEWDGVPRLDNWLSRYLGVEENEYSRFVGKIFLTGAIARGLSPGCKMDTMLVLEGAQGIYKSTAVETLFSRQFFTDEMPSIGSKDASIQMQGMWCVEISEMQAMNKADTNHIKEWVPRKVDKFRPPYGKATIDSPRSCVFVGTLNPDVGYLKDVTGARRFLPVRCTKADIKSLENEREQLWAEARDNYHNSGVWWFTQGSREAELIEHEHADRYEGDSWTDHMDEYLIGKTEVTVSELLEKSLDIPKAQWNKPAEMRVGKHLHFKGWVRKRVQRGGIRQYAYFKEGFQ